MTVYFVGWSSDYNRIMIERIGSQFKVRSIVFPAWFVFLKRALRGTPFKYILGVVARNYLRSRLSGVQKSDLVIYSDSKENYYLNYIDFGAYNKAIVLTNVVEERFVEYVRERFDFIFSFDHAQSSKYGLIPLNQIFPYGEGSPFESEESQACYFFGRDKGRAAKVSKIYEELASRGVRCEFSVVVDSTTRNVTFIHTKESKRYEDVVSDVSKCGVVLEINSEGQSGLTFRALEAMFLGKKLITNNNEVKRMSFYDPSRVYVIREPVDYDDVVRFIKSDFRAVNKDTLKSYDPVYMVSYIDGFIASRHTGD